MDWKVGEAKQQFSEVVRKCARGIQWIYNREARVAAVLSVQEAEGYLQWKSQRQDALGARFARLTQICRETEYEFEAPERSDRETDLGT